MLLESDPGSASRPKNRDIMNLDMGGAQVLSLGGDDYGDDEEKDIAKSTRIRRLKMIF